MRDEILLDGLQLTRGRLAAALIALGGLSNPIYYERMADRLSGVFSDFTLEIFADRHHFDPPHRMEPKRVASSLRALWGRAQKMAS